jgi:hypothetical protein
MRDPMTTPKTPPILADRPVETEIFQPGDDNPVGTVYHHGDYLTLSMYRPDIELDHEQASRLAAALIACY